MVFPRQERMIALTFDDGPKPGPTNEILDILSENQAKATFFVLGNNVTQHPDITRRIVQEGHDIGVHSLSHPNFQETEIFEVYRELIDSTLLLEDLLGIQIKYVRPPYGFSTAEAQFLFNRIGLQSILWTYDTLDWEILDAEVIARNLLDNIQPGDIILLHDIHPTTAQAMQIAIPQLVDQGYELVTISELLEAQGDTFILN
ncbi:polysaccharide deacetylase family protein [Oceanobacillus sp. 1P07AA]|uniref:polysaccharide deacetylase family protein n=1 Tax=Oceanobacillus sp. 1P07AA TaxID=3132293 RepID=UPI0039A535C1